MLVGLGVVPARDIPDPKPSIWLPWLPIPDTAPHTHTHSLTLYMYTAHTSYTYNSTPCPPTLQPTTHTPHTHGIHITHLILSQYHLAHFPTTHTFYQQRGLVRTLESACTWKQPSLTSHMPSLEGHPSCFLWAGPRSSEHAFPLAPGSSGPISAVGMAGTSP